MAWAAKAVGRVKVIMPGGKKGITVEGKNTTEKEQRRESTTVGKRGKRGEALEVR